MTYTVFVKFLDKFNVEIHKIEKPDGTMIDTEHKKIQLDENGRVKDEDYFLIADMLNINVKDLCIHIDDIDGFIM